MSTTKEGKYVTAEIDDQTESDVTFTITDAATGEIKEIVKPTLDQAKAAAREYLQLVENLQQEVDKFENLLDTQEKIRHGEKQNVSTKTEEYIENRKEIRRFLNSNIPEQLYSATFEFQQIVNNLLEQYVEVVFVYTQKGVPDLYTINEKEILKYDYSRSNELTARYYVSNRNYASALTKLEMSDLDSAGLSGLRTTYQESVSRYNRSKVHRVMWLNRTPPPKWLIMKISAVGDINEAYAAVILTHQERQFLDANIENNIDTFMMEYVGKVDNISGLLQGDVEVGNIEYAIKSSKASTLSLKQVIALASRMANEKDFSIDDLKDFQRELKERGVIRNILVEGILDDSIETFEEGVATMQQMQ